MAQLLVEPGLTHVCARTKGIGMCRKCLTQPTERWAVILAVGSGPSPSDQEIVLLGLPAFRCGSHPSRHASTTRPSVPWVLGVTVFDGYYSALAFPAPAEQIIDVKAVLLRLIYQLLA
jgi:hypothetical protein